MKTREVHFLHHVDGYESGSGCSADDRQGLIEKFLRYIDDDDIDAFTIEKVMAEPGPTYCVWTTTGTPSLARQSDWIREQDFACNDDPNGAGARASAIGYAQYLRGTRFGITAVVRPALDGPPPIGETPELVSTAE